jgi:hypothetical protein
MQKKRTMTTHNKLKKLSNRNEIIQFSISKLAWHVSESSNHDAAPNSTTGLGITRTQPS